MPGDEDWDEDPNLDHEEWLNMVGGHGWALMGTHTSLEPIRYMSGGHTVFAKRTKWIFSKYE